MKIFYTEQLEQATLNDLAAVNKGLVKAAVQIRDEARQKFANNTKNYKISKFQDAIMLGRLKKQEHKIAIHGFGGKDDNKELYKARFFILGTRWRSQNKLNGKNLQKSRNIGRITALNTLDDVIGDANIKLEQEIKKALNETNK